MPDAPRAPADDDAALYDFDLPADRIAQHPATERSASRLLVLAGNAPPVHTAFERFPEWLGKGDVLVRNATRVFPARLRGRRAGGGRTELLLVRERAPDTWECLARPASHLKPGKTVTFGDGELVATIEEKSGGGRVTARLVAAGEGTVLDRVEALGETPLPPYIERPDGPDAADRDRYQTVYAKETGAVAAPTAGLHFTPALFEALAERGVEVCDLVLHVGPGTFRPLKSDRISEHRMDAEPYSIPEETAAAVTAAKREGRRVVAVGTTVTRALEAAADEDGSVPAGSGETALFIRPPYRFRVVDGLVTNFHLPRSTLLMLVSALAGRERVLGAYREAVGNGYRFYSYGDAMLLLPRQGAGA